MSKRKPFTSPSWEKAQTLITDEARAYARKNLDLIDMIHLVRREQKLTQAELAAKLHKSPSEVSKWLSPGHNMTLKTVTRLEIALGVSLLVTPLCYRAQRESAFFSTTLETDHYKSLLNQGSFEFSNKVNSLNQTLASISEEITIDIEEITNAEVAGTPSYAMAA